MHLTLVGKGHLPVQLYRLINELSLLTFLHQHFSPLDNIPVIQLTVLEPTEVELNLFQEGHRSQDSLRRRRFSPLDLCVVLFRKIEDTSGEEETHPLASMSIGALVAHSKRQIRGFVGSHAMLEPGEYTVMCLAFNHWNTSECTLANWCIFSPIFLQLDSLLCFPEIVSFSHYPKFLLAIHSSKRLLVETIPAPPFILADSIIRLTIEKGKRHEVSLRWPVSSFNWLN